MYFILALSGVADQTLLPVYHTNCDLQIGDVVNMIQLKYTNKKTENLKGVL